MVHAALTRTQRPQAPRAYRSDATPVVALMPLMPEGIPRGVGGPSVQWPVSESEFPSKDAWKNIDAVLVRVRRGRAQDERGFAGLDGGRRQRGAPLILRTL
jgi:hypothetical protein